MRASDYPEIRALPLFEGMEDGTFEELLRGAYVQTFPPAIELITEGDRADFLYVALDGMVELFASHNHRETVMALVGPVTTFILAATIRDAPYLMSARTLERCEVALLPSNDVRAAFDKDNAFARALVGELAQRYRGAIKDAKNLKLRSSVERVASYLLATSERENLTEFVLPVEKRLLASYLGMAPENFSRAIRALKPYGVEVDGARVVLHDRADLQRLAKPNPLIDDPAV